MGKLLPSGVGAVVFIAIIALMLGWFVAWVEYRWKGMESRARQIMGQPKTDRTQQLHEAARRYTVDEQANRAIEQHNFDKLVAQGTIVEGGHEKRLNPQRYPVGYSHNVSR